MLLSTPHGALGTEVKKYERDGDRISFNSTRCIRNKTLTFTMLYLLNLSTPHGALGTSWLQICSAKHDRPQLSTPHGALGTHNDDNNFSRAYMLSTPHGALGTGLVYYYITRVFKAFNSTRCIRNLWANEG